MTTAQIESVLRGDANTVNERAKSIIIHEADGYVRRLLSVITESGLDVRAMPTVFLGGGAALMKRHLPPTDGPSCPFILDDVLLNAKGYERLVGQISRSVGDG